MMFQNFTTQFLAAFIMAAPSSSSMFADMQSALEHSSISTQFICAPSSSEVSLVVRFAQGEHIVFEQQTKFFRMRDMSLSRLFSDDSLWFNLPF